jgi:hypothetical protein
VTAGQLALAPVAEEPSRGEIPPLDDTRAAAPRPRCCPTCGHPADELAPLTAESPERKARRGDRDTAKAAARLAWPKAESAKDRLVRAIAAAPTGLTAEQAAQQSGVPYQSTSTRVTELVRGNWLRETGQVRPTTTGADAAVLALTEQARAKLRETEAVAA